MIQIGIDATLQSSLEWKREIEIANAAVDQGKRILWKLNLGVFSGLNAALDNQPQFLSLKLSADHFIEKVWSKFQDDSDGVALYSGSLDVSRDFPWNEDRQKLYEAWVEELQAPEMSDEENVMLKQIYCRNMTTEFFDLLVGHWPDETNPIFQFDGSEVLNRTHFLNLLNPTFYPLVKPFVNEPMIDPKASRGFLLPDSCFPWHYSQMEEAVASLGEFRLLSEETLITNWDGLDELVVVEELVSREGNRKLNGFCAAGGEVIRLGNQN